MAFEISIYTRVRMYVSTWGLLLAPLPAHSTLLIIKNCGLLQYLQKLFSNQKKNCRSIFHMCMQLLDGFGSNVVRLLILLLYKYIGESHQKMQPNATTPFVTCQCPHPLRHEHKLSNQIREIREKHYYFQKYIQFNKQITNTSQYNQNQTIQGKVCHNLLSPLISG